LQESVEKGPEKMEEIGIWSSEFQTKPHWTQIPEKERKNYQGEPVNAQSGAPAPR